MNREKGRKSVSRKKRKSVPMQQKKQDDNTVYRVSGIDAALQKKPYIVPGFRSGVWENKKYKKKGKGGSRQKVDPENY